MKKLCDLLFELSNEDRLMILYQLEKKAMKIAHISKKLKFTVQETSRNISRLKEAKLVHRQENGSFELTSYGENSLELLSGFDFLSKHSEYFMTHSTSKLPHEFFVRIGDLVKTKYIDDVMLVFYEAEKMMDEAQNFLWLISDQHLVSAVPHMQKALGNDAKLRILLPSDLHFPDGYFDQECVKEYSIVEKQARKEGRLEERWIKQVDTAMGISELSGRIFFPTVLGSFDYKGFTTTDELSLKYCKDLFEYYWNNASAKIPDQVLKAY